MMTTEEAQEEILKRFSGSTVAVSKTLWRYGSINTQKCYCAISYNFHGDTCSRIESPSFEECFNRLDEEIAAINGVIKERSVLFRKFD